MSDSQTSRGREEKRSGRERPRTSENQAICQLDVKYCPFFMGPKKTEPFQPSGISHVFCSGLIFFFFFIWEIIDCFHENFIEILPLTEIALIMFSRKAIKRDQLA